MGRATVADTGRTVFANTLWADDLWAAGFWSTTSPLSPGTGADQLRGFLVNIGSMMTMRMAIVLFISLMGIG